MRGIRRANRPNLSIETLEDRNLLSGNVLVVIGKTTLVTGDEAANSIEVSPGDEPGEIIFRGLDGTTINGSVDAFVGTIEGGLANVKIDLQGGADLAVITNLSEAAENWPVQSIPSVANDFEIDGNLGIDTGDGEDTVLLRHLDVGGNLDVDTGAGNDIVVAESISVGKKLVVNTGDGADQILGRAVTVTGKSTVNTGAGADALGLYNSTLHKNKVNLGTEADSAWIESNTFANGISLAGGKNEENELTEAVSEHNSVTGKVKITDVAQSLELTSAVHFGYEDEIGPDHWGELTPAFLLSEVGRQQAPINIDTDNLVSHDLPDIALDYVASSDVPFVHNGHTIQVNFAVGNSITVDGDTYDLLQFHFHNESEHTVDGVAFPLEFHLVHRDANGNLLVLAVLVEEGAANAAFDSLIANLPTVGDAAKTIAGPFDPETLLPEDRDYYAYNASLTTPPASEGVSFAIFQTPIQLSAEQIAAINAAIG